MILITVGVCIGSVVGAIVVVVMSRSITTVVASIVIGR